MAIKFPAFLRNWLKTSVVSWWYIEDYKSIEWGEVELHKRLWLAVATNEVIWHLFQLTWLNLELLQVSYLSDKYFRNEGICIFREIELVRNWQSLWPHPCDCKYLFKVIQTSNYRMALCSHLCAACLVQQCWAKQCLWWIDLWWLASLYKYVADSFELCHDHRPHFKKVIDNLGLWIS